MAETRLPGLYLKSGSIPTTALSGGVVSSSQQVIQSLPGGTVSSSQQVGTLIPDGTVSSSQQVKTLLPDGTISSSAQINVVLDLDNVVSSSGQVKDLLPIGTVTSSAQYPGWITASSQVQLSEVAGTSFAPLDYTFTSNVTIVNNLNIGNSVDDKLTITGSINVLGGTISGSLVLPQDTVSSSIQIKTFLPDGSVSSSAQYPGWVTASSQIDYNSITNKLSDVVSSSTQVKQLLPDGTVTSSAQYPGWVTASSQIDYNSITNKLSGVVSSSAQVQPLLPDGTISGSAQYPGWVTASSQIDYNSINNKLSGTVSSSLQVKPLLPDGTISSSAQYPGWVTASSQIDYNNVQNKLSGVVSSSTQVQPLLPGGSVSSSAQYPGWVTASSQVDITATTGYNTFSSSIATKNNTQDVSINALNAATSSYAINSTIQSQFAGVASSSTQVKAYLPNGTVSASAQYPGWVTSSNQILLNSITGTTFSNSAFYFPSDLRVEGNLTAQQIYTEYVSSSVIYESGSTKFGDTSDDVMSVTGSVLVLGGRISGSVVGMFSSSTQIDYNNIQNKLSGVVSSSTQVQPLLPNGTVSSSAQYQGWVTASSQIDYNSIQNKLSGVVSSSTQVQPLLPAGTVSSSVQVDYNSITNKLSGVVSSSTQIKPLLPDGTVSSSLQINTGSFSGSITTASYVLPSGLPVGSVSASSQIDYNSIQNKLSGVVSSSTQVQPLLPNGTVSSSVQVDYNSITNKLSGVVSTSVQVQPLLPGGSVSSSAQYPGWVTASSQVDYNNIQNKLSGVVSSSTQIQPLLPGGTVSSSVQINTGSFTGSFIGVFTGSILANNVVSSSAQIIAALPSDTVSSSTQVKTFLPNGTVSSSAQYPGWVTASSQIDYNNIQNKLSGVVSSSTQFNALTGTSASYALTASFALATSGVVQNAISASYTVTASYVSAAGIVSSSSQIDYNSIQNKLSGVVSSSVQVKPLLPDGTVSSSAQYPGWVTASSQIDVRNTTGIATIATTGSNTFTGIQTISNTTNSTEFNNGALIVQGGVGITKDVNISGSLTVSGLLTAVSTSVQYVTSSQLNVADNKIVVNTNDLVRFGGLSIVDSGSASPTTASIYWDSLAHNFIYENLSGSSYNSAIFIAGPKNTGTIGNEVGLTTNRIPVAVDSDHIDSRPVSSSMRVDFPSRLTHVEAGLFVTGNLTANGTVILQGIPSSSTQITALLPSDTVSSSTQVKVFLPNGTVSASAQYPGWVTASSQIDYNSIQNKLSGVVSSSTQVQPLLPANTVSSSTQVTAFLPVGTISSSTQFKTLSDPFTGSFTGSHTGTFPYSGLTNTPSGIVSSSTQVQPLLPAGSVSSSAQYPGWVTSSTQIDYNNIQNKLSGVVSSSTQVQPLLPSGTVSSSGQVDYNSIQNKLSGVVSSSAQVKPLLPDGTVSSSTQQIVSAYTNATNDRVLTSTGAGGINGESALTFDGTVLSITTNGAKYFQGGDDAALYDVNVSNTLGIHGQQDSTVGAIKLGSSGQTIYSNATGVGIGTITPGALLHVQGNVSASSFTGSFSGTHTGTFPYASLTGIPSGIVSSSTQVATLLPASTVSSSTASSPSQGTVRVTINGVNTDVDTGLQTGDSPTFSGLTSTGTILLAGIYSSSGQVTISSTTGYSTFSSSIATKNDLQDVSINALNAATSSYAINSTIQTQLAGVVSSSAQVKPLLPGGTVTSSAQYPGWVTASSQVLLNAITGTTFSNSAFYFPSDLRVEGNLTAQQIYTEFVSSSVIYESGSTKFGDTTDDVMSVTGSIRVLGGNISGSFIGLVSQSAQIDYNSIQNKLSGVVSSSTQVQPLLPNGTISSSAQYPGWITASSQIVWSSVNYNAGIVSSSTASAPSQGTVRVTINGVNTDVDTGLQSGDSPTFAGLTSTGTVLLAGIYSSSGQVTISSTTGYSTFSSSIATKNDLQDISINALNVATSSYAINSTIQSQLAGVASSSAQVKVFLPNGTVSASAQYPGWVTASSQIDYNSITNKLSGVVSSSTQVATLLPASTVSSSTASSPSQGTVRVTINGTNTDVDTGLQTGDSPTFTGLYTTGNVGIGTSSPNARLHVSGGISIFNSSTANSNANSGIRIVSPIATTHYNWLVGAQNNIDAGFEITPSTTQGGTTFSTPALTVLATGNVGVNVTPNNAKLEVVATSGEIFRADAASGAYRIVANQSGVNLNGNVGIGVTTPNQKLSVNGNTNITGSLDVTGAFTAQTKSFKINHQTIPNKSLVYGVLEGPEHAVYVRGRLTNNNTIILPAEWDWLIDPSSITVQLTPIGSHQKLYVDTIVNNVIFIKNENLINKDIDCFYLVHATRKDVEPLQTVQ